MSKKHSAAKQQRLRALIREAIVDCYNEGEEWQGFVACLESEVVCPFTAKVIGEAVEVTALHGSSHGPGVVANCQYKGKEYPIDLTSLVWTKQRPEGFEWIEAYFEWLESVG
jgi:hypothetical protein